MLLFIKRIAVAFLALITAIVPPASTLPQKPKPTENDFRVSTYIVADSVQNESDVHPEDFDIITNVILFGCVRFDRDGNVIADENKLCTALKNIKSAIGERDIKISLNILGPSYQGETSGWEEQMKMLGKEHNHAFRSRRLIKNIVDILYKYDFDGVHFDYEYPISKLNWLYFNNFLVSLKSKLPNKELGVAVSAWDMKLSVFAINAVDYVEFMLYDVFDNDGRHATYETCEEISKEIEKTAIPKEKVNFGLPFYSRPTDHSGYWYGYKDYVDLLDKDGFYHDEKINKDFYFNTPDVIEEKTEFAFKNGFGGVMIWNYACDLPSSDERSLLKGVQNAIYRSLDKKPFTGKDYTIPEIDLSVMPECVKGTNLEYLFNLSTVDNSKDYLAHPDSVLLKNGNILTLYPAGHGKGAILNRISTDGGISWSENIKNTPKSWENSKETPTVYRLKFTDGTPDKLILISANPKWWDEETTEGGFNCSISCDEGNSWSEFKSFYTLKDENSVVPIVAMSSLVRLKENGKFVDKWMGVFHDSEFYNYKTILTFDKDGNMHWSKPEKYFSKYREIEKKSNMCEVQIIRSDEGSGDELCLISRSNSKNMNSLISFSNDEGKTWSYPRQVPAALNGERHKAVYAPDGRLFITFRSIERGPTAKKYAKSITKSGFISEGWVAWVGTYEDLKNGTEGQYRIKLAHVYADEVHQQKPEYYAGSDTGYSGNVVLPDGTIVTTSYGKFDPVQRLKPHEIESTRRTYIASKRINLKDTDTLLEMMK